MLMCGLAIVVLASLIRSVNTVSYWDVLLSLIIAIGVGLLAGIAMYFSNRFLLKTVRLCHEYHVHVTTNPPHSRTCLCGTTHVLRAVLATLCVLPASWQSMAFSIVAFTVEAACLRVLIATGSPSFATMVSGVMIMQVAMVAVCLMFAALWFRALARVRAAIKSRTSALHRVNRALTRLGLSRVAYEAMQRGITTFQAIVRSRLTRLRARREQAMDAYAAAAPDRNFLLWLVNAVTALYLALCIYTALVYGACGTCGIERPLGTVRRGCDACCGCLWQCRCACSRSMCPYDVCPGTSSFHVSTNIQLSRTCERQPNRDVLISVHACVSFRLAPAIKFSPSSQRAWFIASALGFALDVAVYHTFSLFMRSVMKFLVVISRGTDQSTLATGLARSLDVSSCAFSGIYTY